MRRTLPLLAVLTLSACATVGPPRPTLVQALSGEEDSPPAREAPPDEGRVQALSQPEEAPPEAPAVPESEDLPAASPFSAGLMVGVGMYLDGSGRVLPAQLAVGTVKVAALGPRAVNVLALGGLTGTSIAEARAAWGGGASVELTPGTLPYAVDAAVGVLWVAGEGSPAALVGFTLTPKM